MTPVPLQPLALLVLVALGMGMAALLGLVAWALQAPRRGGLPLVLVVLAAPGARAEEVADVPAVPFECPEVGRVPGDAPADYHQGPDARCVAAGSLAVLYGPDGLPLPRMTRVGPGWYLTAEGWHLADAGYRRVQRERNTCREELAACRQAPLPGVPVAPPAIAEARGWSTGTLVAVGVAGVLLGGYVGCRATGGCR